MYLIGLTGNIASGKSTVRQMLEQLGARAIDADALAHAVLSKGTPAWRAVADTFGAEVLREDGEVDRPKLGALVFADPVQLQKLEAIVHPAVSIALARLLSDAREPVVVVEAVKLIEAGLDRYCDAVWIVTVPQAEAKRRLIQGRGLGEIDAQLRLRAQPPVKDKLRLATVVIDNGGTIDATRDQVARAFASIRPESAADKTQSLSELLGAAPRTPSPPGSENVESDRDG
jgi:dephospho-CoA kinase